MDLSGKQGLLSQRELKCRQGWKESNTNISPSATLTSKLGVQNVSSRKTRVQHNLCGR